MLKTNRSFQSRTCHWNVWKISSQRHAAFKIICSSYLILAHLRQRAFKEGLKQIIDNQNLSFDTEKMKNNLFLVVPHFFLNAYLRGFIVW